MLVLTSSTAAASLPLTAVTGTYWAAGAAAGLLEGGVKAFGEWARWGSANFADIAGEGAKHLVVTGYAVAGAASGVVEGTKAAIVVSPPAKSRVPRCASDGGSTEGSMSPASSVDGGTPSEEEELPLPTSVSSRAKATVAAVAVEMNGFAAKANGQHSKNSRKKAAGRR